MLCKFSESSDTGDFRVLRRSWVKNRRVFRATSDDSNNIDGEKDNDNDINMRILTLC